MQGRLPIAVFDSGVGGLTVVAALRRALPQETIHYLGDTARLPYGTKSPAVVERYAMACGKFLSQQGAKLLLVACNTASAHALRHLQANMPMPVVGVIEPSAGEAARRSPYGQIGVLATEGTVLSGCYQRALTALSPQAVVTAVAAPLFVPMAEEGMTQHPALEIVAREYLAPLLAQNIDTLVLGCTHYPLLQPLLQRLCGAGVHIVDSASAVAAAAQTLLATTDAFASERHGPDRFFATDMSARLQRVGSCFLGEPMGEVALVDI